MTTERELVEAFFGVNTTNDINDVVQHLVNVQTNSGNSVTTEDVISEIKSVETDITDWTI
tara:strand:- start:340 stop:519 length:180 start_codon:yes stop_codon:yes gene_type:complete